MKAIGLSLILLCGFVFGGSVAFGDETAPYDPKSVPLSISADLQKKEVEQKAKAKQIADDVLGPQAPAPRSPDEEAN